MCLALVLKDYVLLPLVPVADYLSDLEPNSSPSIRRKASKRTTERDLDSLRRISKCLEQTKQSIGYFCPIPYLLED